ncbi:MAG: hypothetical protein A2087_07920 [Spirochaetes bacterium GWD1_61_31]|nr:MAG: hypothetical protein A2Y37_06160 [Spirochaetes bacterium GWB1_60_80]OHD35006.1 MAG: hypothetical protein A2004_03985 [Spirochaetes bacterium GWC1_61_12]OHD40476.1 MAG: hypothetical protein A2087_07920 [Spirochaetes bacterium GWD1_61_31]OHD43099.1 MAG: hypothetical protein A2Y35_01455 [Spirochaetes bacterium GWE1_60_18]
MAPAVAKSYRRLVNDERFRLFELNHRETNLLVGVDQASWQAAIAVAAGAELVRLRAGLDDYIGRQPAFASSWEPLRLLADAPPLAVAMAAAARLAGVGPMAAVAGAFAAALRDFIASRFTVVELFVENGGDCALLLERELVVGIVAGDSAFSGRHGFRLPPGRWGVASSAGRLGHSRSLGQADVCAVAAVDPAVADALATAVGNRVGGAHDVAAVLEHYRAQPEILGLYIAAGKVAGCRGRLPLCPLARAGCEPRNVNIR